MTLPPAVRWARPEMPGPESEAVAQGPGKPARPLEEPLREPRSSKVLTGRRKTRRWNVRQPQAPERKAAGRVNSTAVQAFPNPPK